MGGRLFPGHYCEESGTERMRRVEPVRVGQDSDCDEDYEVRASQWSKTWPNCGRVWEKKDLEGKLEGERRVGSQSLCSRAGLAAGVGP